MPITAIFYLRALEAALLPRSANSLLMPIFLSRIEAVDPQLAEAFHESEKRRPYAISPLFGRLQQGKTLFQENHHTVAGEISHERAHTQGHTTRPGLRQWRNVALCSNRYRIQGRSDCIEEQSDQVYPVEYKKGSCRTGRPWHNDIVQLCAEAICIEEMRSLPAIAYGYIFYIAQERRYRVELNDEVRAKTVATITAVHELL